MTWPELLAVLAPLGTLFVVAAKWLVNDWQKKNELLANLQKETYNGSLRKLEAESKLLRNDMLAVKQSMQTHAANMQGFYKKLEELQEDMKAHKHYLDAYVSNLDLHVKQAVRTQVITLTEQLKLMKDKKNGQP